MELKPANQRVVEALKSMNIACDIRILDHETRTSQAAAIALGCRVSQIAKSLIFKTLSNRPVLAITSGSNRVALDRLSAIVGEKVGKANADDVKAATGFVIGGVAPVGLANLVDTVFDRDLFDHDVVWAAAGTANSLFPIAKEDLKIIAGERIFDFAAPTDTKIDR